MVKAAKQMGRYDGQGPFDLKRNLLLLRDFGAVHHPDPVYRKTFGKVVLYGDFAPLSLTWQDKREGGSGLAGGLIYHGAHDRFGSGAAPALAVCVNPVDGWSLHT
jgi:hypothetical protein